MRAANIARLTLCLAPLGALLLFGSGCSAGGDKTGSSTASHGGMGSLNLAGTGNAATSSGSGGGLVIGIGGNDGSGSASGPCEGGGWRCKVPDCTGQTPTSIRASVYDPAGVTPLYDVAVYVPNSDVTEIATGAVCETCATPVSGDPIASALTDAHGEFTMTEGVPAGSDVPLVLQIGKWRRVIALPEVKPCQENVFDDKELFRLPRNQSEGHLPKIALTTGEADALECFLRRIGVADSEFTNPDGAGRINLFHDTSGGASYASGGSYPPVSALRASLDVLKGYDIVLMSCVGSQSDGRLVTAQNKQDLQAYLDMGGRAFLEHYHHAWLRGGNESMDIEYARKYTPTPFPAVATWVPPDDPNYDGGHAGQDAPYTVDTSFPKGKDFADWLEFVGASPGGHGTISLFDVKHPAMATLPPAQQWISDATGVPYFSFNTPLAAAPEAQCGRLVHTGIHVGVEQLTGDKEGPFPSGCKSAPLTAQEKALEFLLFDLSSCVMNTHEDPQPPVVVK
ncbi:MAG TPA: carboxypeptidase regulatory-like domain-containing protein [Polyangiaceae bacterium]|nr:carboxypeptidase regulatory-like domain-containing protein [Polyangiaceae bacterium]